MQQQRRLPIGAELMLDGGVHFRVWAPRRRQVEVVLEQASPDPRQRNSQVVKLEAEGDGYFSGQVAEAVAGSLYRYRLDGAAELYPDPASRFQPEGPHGPAQVIDPGRFRWTDSTWGGTPLQGQVIYELH